MGRGGGSGHGGGQGGNDDGFWEEGRVEVPPRLLHRQDPPYPEMARRRGIEGMVIARILVGTNGHVQIVRIESAHPAAVFEDTVTKTLLSWRFTPAQRQGTTVAVWMRVPIRFQLR